MITGTLRGAGDTKSAMLLALMSQWMLQFPLAYILSRHTQLGEQGIWWSFALSHVVAALVTAGWLYCGDWKCKQLLEEIQLQKRVQEEAQLDEGMTS